MGRPFVGTDAFGRWFERFPLSFRQHRCIGCNALAVIVLTLAAMASMALAADASSQTVRGWAAERERRELILLHAREIRPRRLDGPLRELNISDDEVREIQDSVAPYLSKEWVSISGVTVGCPCEDGAACSNQVWIYSHEPKRTVGLMLSRIAGRWVVGPVQTWWLHYSYLISQRDTYSSYDAYQDDLNAAIDMFPICSGAPAISRSAEVSAQR